MIDRATRIAIGLRIGRRIVFGMGVHGDVVADLLQVAAVGAVQAADAYDPGKEAAFKSYAWLRVRAAVIDELRKHTPRSAYGRGERRYDNLTDPSDMEASCVAETISPDDAYQRRADARWVRRAVDLHVTDRRGRELVKRHDLGGELLQVVARDLGISKSWATRVRAVALEQLQAATA